MVSKIELVVKENIPLGNKRFGCSEDIFKSEIVEKELINADREKFIVLHLNVKNEILSYEVASIGSLTNSIVYPREVFKGAILANSASIILLHNHPSGDPELSIDDIEITRRLVKSGDILGIKVLEHLVVAGDKYFSFTKERML